MNVVVVAEYYPRAADPVLGIWAHRQAVAARDAGAHVRVLVLYRPVPPKAALRQPTLKALLDPLRQPSNVAMDGIEVRYVRFLAPPRWRTYGTWGAYAAPPLRRALRALARERPIDLIHAHYAVPAGDAVRRAAPRTPAVVSVHGGDLIEVARRAPTPVERALAHARLVLANSAGTAERARTLGAGNVRVVHLGTDVPPRHRPAKPEPAANPEEERLVWRATSSGDGKRQRRRAVLVRQTAPGPPPRIATLAHVVSRKRHADVARALWLLRDEVPNLRWTVIGDGPERPRLERLVSALGIADRVEFTGALPNEQAKARAREADAFVLPSVDEAFGVAYVEAMAGGLPAVGCMGESGPEEIAATGGGIVLVPPGDIEQLAEAIRMLVCDPIYRAEVARRARDTVRDHYTWEACGAATVAAYRAALE